MGQVKNRNDRSIGKKLLVYLGSAWVIIEALNFLIDKYYWNSRVLDILIILIIFGLPAMVIHLFFDRKFTRKTIILHSINILVTVAVISFSFIKPNAFNTNQIRLIKFQNDQKKLAASVRSLAILPFSNFTGTESHASLVNGLHDALISEFGQIGAIRVISRTSTLPYANSQKSIKSIASELKVDAIIETSVLSVNEEIRIQVKLINAVPEQQLWSRTFNTRLDNIMGLYNQIIKNIASQIQLALSPDESNILNNPPLVNPEAYKAYLEGIYQSEKLSATGFQQAKESFQRSIELDSMFAPVYTGVAFAWIGAAQMRIVPLTEAIPKIYEYYQKALVIDDNYPEAQYIKALMSAQGEWDWIKSETAFRKAIEMDPGHALSHAYYGHLLLMLKRFDEAIYEMDKALEIDPNNHLVLLLYAVVLWHHGDLDQAIKLAQQSQDINPNNDLINTILEDTKYLKGDLHGSMEILILEHGDNISGFDAVVNEYDKNGYEQAMLKLAALFQDQAQVNYFNIALYYNRAGRHEEAILWLEKGFENHDLNMPYAFLPAEFNNLRSDPRYRELANKMKLPF